MNDKIIELKNRYVPAKFALDHLVDCARKGGGTVAGAQKVLWDFLECASALTAQPVQPLRLVDPTVHIENCSFKGTNEDGSEVFKYRACDDGMMVLTEIRMVGWNCQGPTQPVQPATSRESFEEYMLTREAPSSAKKKLAMREGVEYLHEHVARHWFTWQQATKAAQPVQPAELAALRAQRVPMTDDQVEDMRGEANRGFNIEREDYAKAVRDTEAFHGIGAKP